MNRRSDYYKHGFSDSFIVSLLNREIGDFIDNCSQYFDNQEDLIVLDVGCGEQPWKDKILSKGFKYYSLDITQNRSKTVDFIGQIDEINLLSVLPFKGFHIILCTEVMEHVFDWKTAFHNLNELVCAGGIIYITTPFFFQLHEEPFDFWRPTIHGLKQSALSAGLVPVVQKKVGDSFDVLGTLLGSAGFSLKKKTAKSVFFWLLFKPCLKVIYHLLKKGLISSKVGSSTDRIYLSNVSIYAKSSIRRPCP